MPQAAGPTGREPSERVQEASSALHTRDADAIAIADEVLGQAAALSAHRVIALHEELAGLRLALESRAVIEQAKGVLMATSGCSADEAFELLRRQSQHENRKLRDIAQELVAAQRRPRPT